jgi:hypothetical protein
MVNNEQRCERLGFYFLIYFLTRFRRRFWPHFWHRYYSSPTKSAPVAPNGYLGKPKEIDDLNPYYLVGW